MNRKCPCEPWALPNMAKDFFDHLLKRHFISAKAKDASATEAGNDVQMRVREDFLTFKSDVDHCIKGWDNSSTPLVGVSDDTSL